MSEFEYNSPMFMQTVYLGVKDAVTEAIQHMQATGFIEEIAGQIKGDTTLATRLAAVEAERDALREGLEAAVEAMGRYHGNADEYEHLVETMNRLRALLGKETQPDGQ